MNHNETGVKDMEKSSLIQHIKAAANKLKDSKLKRQAAIATSLEAIRQALSLENQEQAMMLVVILDRQCSQRDSDIDGLSSYLGCSTRLSPRGNTSCARTCSTPS